MDTFVWIPSSQSAAEGTANVHEIQFGDGYVGSGANGINNTKEDWNLVFDVLKVADWTAIRTFLKVHGGYLSFYWTPPFETAPRTYVCKQWGPGIVGGQTVSLNCKFEERFVPGS